MVQTSYNTILYGQFVKTDISNHEDFLKDIKNNMKKIVVPEIEDLAVVEIVDDNYLYPAIYTNIGQLLYFDQKNKLYINQE